MAAKPSSRAQLRSASHASSSLGKSVTTLPDGRSKRIMDGFMAFGATTLLQLR